MKKEFLDIDIPLGGPGIVQKALFAKLLAVMLKSGISLNDALTIAIDTNRGKLKNVLRGVLKSVESGNSLADSFARYPKVFSGAFISSTFAGETAGTLEENLENIAIQLEKEKELVEKIRSAMLYPIIVLVASFILGIAMVFLVLPKITPLFEGLRIDLPITTRALIAFANVVQSYGMILLSGLVACIVGIIWLVRQKFMKPIIHWTILRIPIVKEISRNSNLVRFCSIFSMLLKSGLNVDEALVITKGTLGNYYYQQAVENVSRRIQKGTKISDSLRPFENLFPIMIIEMIRVGEESGSLEDTLAYLGNFYEIEIENSTKALSTALEPILLGFIGLVVAFLALSIITPIYYITGNIAG